MTVSAIKYLPDGTTDQAAEIQIFFNRVRSDIIAIAIEGSITKTSLNKFRLHRGVYEWTDSGVIINNYGHTMLYFILKIVNPSTRIGVSNLNN